METIKIKEVEVNNELKGLVITLSDNRVFYIQYELETNRLSADYETYFACRYIFDEATADNFTEEEESALLTFANSFLTNDEIIALINQTI